MYTRVNQMLGLCRLFRRSRFCSALLTLLVRSLPSCRFLALRELDRGYAWFGSRLEAIAPELMSAVAYGVKARA